MSKKMVDCPIRGTEYNCNDCEFYTNKEREKGDFVCVYFATMDALIDTVNLLRLNLDSNERTRMMFQQSFLTQMNNGKATKELKKMLGIEDEV